MRDLYERTIDYLRISITESCNLRCTYCIPDGTCERQAKKQTLSFDEIIKLVSAAAQIGIRKIKITGGEPLVRGDVPALVKEIKKIEGIEEVTLTTNGILLHRYIDELVEAKLDGLNISLDTLDRKTYETLTKYDGLEAVLAGIQEAIDQGIPKVKINTVAIKELNEKELTQIATLAKHQKVHVRFIELMPIGYGKAFTPITKETIIDQLEEAYGELMPCNQVLGNGPAQYYSIKDFKGKIGFISAVSHAFCENCNRVRVTCEGYLKLCLHYNQGVDLKPYLQPNVEEECLIEIMRKSIQQKPLKHSFNEKNLDQAQIENKGMSQIGG